MKVSFFTSSFLIVILFSLSSCKEDPEAQLPGEIVLGKVFRDGKLEFEYRYNSSNQLSQIREYDLATGQLDYYSEYLYDSRGVLQEEISYNSEEKPSSKKKFVRNSQGQFLSSEIITLTGADSGKVTTRYKYAYNKLGFLIKETWCDPKTEEEISYRAYSYYPNGNLERSEYFWTVVPSPEKAFELRCSPAGELLPETISKHRGYPIDFRIYQFVAEKIEHEVFDSGLASASEYHEVISDRTYNNDGFITQQTITTKFILPEQPDEVITMTFEYLEI